MKTKQSGFTIVELLVTVITAAMFVGMFYQLFVVLVGINSTARNTAQASDLAYSNLRRYPDVASTGLTCNTSTNVSTTVNLIPASGSPTATVNANYPELGAVIEQVTAQFPYGCSAVYNVVKLVSTVTYGTSSYKVSYATYVN